MATPISTIQSVTFPAPTSPRNPARGGDPRRAESAPGAVSDPSLAMLETMAGQVAESTGEACTATPTVPPGETDPSYRVELMGFIVGSLSRAVQALRGPQAAPAEEPAEEAPGEEEAAAGEDEAVVEAALPEAALPAPVEGEEEAADADPSGYGQDGQPREAAAPARVDRWI